MIKSKIMSYITKISNRKAINSGGEEWQKVVLKMQSKFADAGAKATVSQVFNKDGIQR